MLKILEKLVCSRLRMQRLLAKCESYCGPGQNLWAKQLERQVPVVDASNPDLVCPLRPCRAPELAAGALGRHLDTQCECVVSTLDAKRRFESARLGCDAGYEHLHCILSLKLGHWAELPWEAFSVGPC